MGGPGKWKRPAHSLCRGHFQGYTLPCVLGPLFPPVLTQMLDIHILGTGVWGQMDPAVLVLGLSRW